MSLAGRLFVSSLLLTAVAAVMWLVWRRRHLKENRRAERECSKRLSLLQAPDDHLSTFTSMRGADNMARLSEWELRNGLEVKRAEVERKHAPRWHDEILWENSKAAMATPVPTISEQGDASRASQSRTDPKLLPHEELCHDYNNAVQSGSYREFRRKYKQQTTMIGLQNALEYMNDRTVDVVFVAKDDGKYLGVALGNLTYVFPKLGMTFLEIDHGPGAMSKVFDCGNFSKDYKYLGVEVASPAVFIKSGTQYLLKHRGELKLGDGINR